MDTPFWPIFVENFVRAVAGSDGRDGYRVHAHAFDPRVSRLGRDVAPFDARWLDGVKAADGAAPRNLRPFVVGVALLAFGALWGVPLVRRRRRVP